MRLVVVIILSSMFLGKMAFATFEQRDLTADIKAYCQYIKEKHSTKSKLLLAPDVVVRVQNSNNDYLLQNNLVSALSKDLVDFSKAKKIKTLIIEDCRFYHLNQEAKVHIQFAMARIRISALRYKLAAIRKAKNRIRQSLRIMKKRVDSHHDTLQSYYQMSSLLKRIEYEEHDIYVKLAMDQVPKMHRIKLNDLLKKINDAQRKRQATRNQLAKDDNWSLQVQLGAQQQYSAAYAQQKQTVQPYAGLVARYNLGAITSNSTMNQSLKSYMNWKNKQVNSVQSQLIELMRSASLLYSIELEKLRSLKANYKQNTVLSKKIGAIGTVRASSFGQQLDMDRILATIEINYIEQEIKLLRELL